MNDNAPEKPKVVSLHGGVVLAAQTEPNQEVVETLTNALEKAKAGELQGTVMVMLHKDGATSFDSSGRGSRAMLGAMTMLVHQLAQQFLDEI